MIFFDYHDDVIERRRLRLGFGQKQVAGQTKIDGQKIVFIFNAPREIRT